MSLEIYQFPYLSDNYGVLLHCSETGQTAAIDAGDASAYLSALEAQNWHLSLLLITHHHWDHTDGLEEIKTKTGCKVIGPNPVSNKINGLDETRSEGETITFGSYEIQIIHTPGHTVDMINFYIKDEKLLFAGDTLFTLGCGRVFEGTKPMMWESLLKLKRLPEDTIIYSSHEYTLTNIKFAQSVDPQNKVLIERAEKLKALRDENQATVPSLLSDELATNPFLRADDIDIRKFLGMEDATDSEVFCEIRSRKDNF